MLLTNLVDFWEFLFFRRCPDNTIEIAFEVCPAAQARDHVREIVRWARQDQPVDRPIPGFEGMCKFFDPMRAGAGYAGLGVDDEGDDDPLVNELEGDERVDYLERREIGYVMRYVMEQLGQNDDRYRPASLASLAYTPPLAVR